MRTGTGPVGIPAVPRIGLAGTGGRFVELVIVPDEGRMTVEFVAEPRIPPTARRSGTPKGHPVRGGPSRVRPVGAAVCQPIWSSWAFTRGSGMALSFGVSMLTP